MEPHAFSVLGGLEKPVDKRDIPLGAVSSPVYTFPATYSNPAAWAADIEYQGQQPACGAHAGSKLNAIKTGERMSPRYTWANIKTFDGFALADGTDMRSIFKSGYNTGTTLFEPMENDVSGSLFQYAHPTITQAMNKDAATHKLPGYGFATDLSFNGLKQYIYEHGAVIILIRVSARLYTAANGQTSWAEKDILPLAPPGGNFPSIGGHFVVCHSYDENYIYFINSFGPTWGRNGHGYIGANYMPSVLDAGTSITLAFDKDLFFGMTDPEVKSLQVLLNKNATTRVAVSGPGSPGQETTYFGPATKAAVVKFQTLHNIMPNQGYVGPLTRAVLNTQ